MRSPSLDLTSEPMIRMASAMTIVAVCASCCTGKERDSESGLDYFGARYYGSALGRFTSPDWSASPEPVPYANLNNPQSFNQYSYVGNNPVSLNDPTGHCPPCIAEAGPAIEEASEWVVTKSDVIMGGLAVLGSAIAAKGDAIITALENPPAMTGSHFGMAGDGGFTQIAMKENKGDANSGEQEADTVRQGKREAMRQEGIPTSQQPQSQTSTEGGRQAVYEVPKPGGGTQTKVVTVNHADSSHPGQTHVEAGNAKAGGQTDSLGRLRVVNDKTKINIKKPEGQ
jgi:RHS repeat-associated protein